MKMKNIILIIFTLIIGVAEALGQTLPTTPNANGDIDLTGGTIYTATPTSGNTVTINGTLVVPTTGGPVTIYIPAGVTLDVTGNNAGKGYSGINGDYTSRTNHTTNTNSCNSSSTECAHNGNKEKACGGAGGHGAKPAIRVAYGATLIITGEGYLKIKGGNGGNGGRGGDGQSGSNASGDDYGGAGGGGGGGGGGAAPAIGGIGGTGGAGGAGAQYTNDGQPGMNFVAVTGKTGSLATTTGLGGEAMGNVYIIGNVSVDAEAGTRGDNGSNGSIGNSPTAWSMVGGTWYYHTGSGGNGGFAGSNPYSIGGGGNGGVGGNGGNGGSINTSSAESVTTSQTYTSGTGNNGTLKVQKNSSLNTPNLGSSTTYDLSSYSTINDESDMPNDVETRFTMDYIPTKHIYYGTKSYMDLASIPTRAGYTFKGYKSTETGRYNGTPIASGTLYYDEDGKFVAVPTDDDGVLLSLFTPGTITLEAVWEANTYPVTLVKQGGTGGTEEIEVTYDSAMPSATAPTRTGFTFNGYFYNPDGTGTKYYNGDMTSAHVWDVSTVPDGGFKLYAHWTPTIYTVYLDNQEGTGGTSSVTVTYGSVMPTVLPNDEPVTAPTRTGFTFAGYYSGINGTGTKYYNENMESVNNWDIDTNPCTLYAHWTGTYTLTFDVNGGNPLVPNSKEVIYNNEYGELPTPTWTGHTFDGWFTSATGGEEVTSETKMGDTDVTIYAHWTIITYTVTLYLEGGSGGTTSVEVTYGSTMPSATAPTRPGYIFGGYFTGTNGTGTQYYNVDMTSAHNWDIDVYPINSGKLYANWTPITYTVTFDPQKGSVNPTTKGVKYGNTYGELPSPTRHGFLFKGWYTTENGGSEDGTEITGSETYSIIGPQTLYAHWNTTSFEIDAYSEERLAGFYFRTFFDSQVTCILPAGVKAYKGNIDGRYLVLTAIVATDDIGNNVIPKDVPVILRMDPNDNTSETVSGFPTIQKKTITLTTTEYDPVFTKDNNGLTGSDDGIATAPANSYILSFGSKGLGFYAWATHPLEDHKAYVINPSGSSAKALIFRFEDDAAGISQDAITDFDSDDSELVIHNLNGIRISKPQKGINIINGKKVWVK